MHEHTHGGKREGAGRPVGVADRIVLLDVALHGGKFVPRREGVSIRWAQEIIREKGAASVIGEGREKLLRELAASDEGAAFLRIQETKYLAKRYEAGFDS
jgi:hypothetical protein